MKIPKFLTYISSTDQREVCVPVVAQNRLAKITL